MLLDSSIVKIADGLAVQIAVERRRHKHQLILPTEVGKVVAHLIGLAQFVHLLSGRALEALRQFRRGLNFIQVAFGLHVARTAGVALKLVNQVVVSVRLATAMSD